MKQFFKKRGLFIGLAAAVVCLITGLSLLFTSGGISFLESGVNSLMQPFASGIRSGVGALERTYDYMYNYDTLLTENEQLKDQLAEYEQLIQGAQETAEENERLRELLDLKEQALVMDLREVAVVNWGSSNWSSSFTINKGSDADIEVGDPVITERGELVGLVAQVDTSSATVRSIVDIDINVGARIGTTSTALATGDFKLMQQGLLRLSYVSSDVTPLIGETITTSGLGEIIPKGLTVGTIADVQMEATGTNYYAVIQPAADLYNLTQVFVVRDFELKE